MVGRWDFYSASHAGQLTHLLLHGEAQARARLAIARWGEAAGEVGIVLLFVLLKRHGERDLSLGGLAEEVGAVEQNRQPVDELEVLVHRGRRHLDGTPREDESEGHLGGDLVKHAV